MLILEFSTQSLAQNCLDAINGYMASWWAGQGYTVQNGQLIGKNAATGEDEPQACRTVTWDDVRESPDQTFYFASLSDDPRFSGWQGALAEAGFTAIGTERDFPMEWAEASAL